MGLEASTYISGLTSSWPPSGDPKSQGDDHLRLIKGVLQSTFPTATGPMYFPKTESTSSPLVLDITDQNNLINVTTTAGDVAVTLPAGFTTTNAGWSCEVLKVTTDTNAAVVSPTSGSIYSKVGPTATIRVGAYMEPCRFVWTGAGWVAVKPGPMIGSTINWDGTTVPYGCLTLDGSAFNSTTYAELFAALGSATLRDKRGRVEAGVDSATSRLGNAMPGQLANGGVGGFDYHYLTLAQLPAHSHANTASSSDGGHTHTGAFSATNLIGNVAPLGNSSFGYGYAPASSNSTSTGYASITTTMSNANAGSSSWHPNVQPTIVTNKLIRAC